MNWFKLKADGIERIFFSIVFAVLTVLGRADQTSGLEYANANELFGGNMVSILWWAFIAWLFISGVSKYKATSSGSPQ